MAADWPGTRRRTFLLVALALAVAWQFVPDAVQSYLVEGFGAKRAETATSLVIFAPLALMAWLALRRLSNLGMSRWWCLAALAPVANIWLGFRCIACPAGYSYYRKMDAAGIILAILYFIMVVTACLLFAALLFLIFSAKARPELLKQVVEAVPAAHPYLLELTGDPPR